MPPDWWWWAWWILALFMAAFRQWSPRYFTHLTWAWTDYRLLLQSRGDFMAPWYSGWMQNAAVGAAFALGIAGMLARVEARPPDAAQTLRMWALWCTIMLMRWAIARLWQGLSLGAIPGKEWGLGHRYVMESLALILAPLGLCFTMWGPEAAVFGLYFTGAVWGIGWGSRQHRTFIRIPRLKHRPIEGIFYLCALELLPVAVLFRAWQW